MCGRRAVARACSLLTHVKRMQNSFCPCACARSIDRERRRRRGAVCRPPAGAPEPEAAGRACVRSSLVGLSLRCGTSSEQLGDREIDRRTKSTREREERSDLLARRPSERTTEGGRRTGGWVLLGETQEEEKHSQIAVASQQQPSHTQQSERRARTTSARPPQTIRHSSQTNGGLRKVAFINIGQI